MLQLTDAVDEYVFDLGCYFEGAAVGDDDIRILAGFEGTDAVFDADVTGGVDGDGLERLKRIHAGLYRETCAQGQILLRDDGRVGDNGYMAAGLTQYAGSDPAFVSEFEFAGVAERRADSEHYVFFGELIGDQVAFGHVLKGNFHAEFLSDAKGGEEVVCLMGVRFQGHFTADDRQERMKLHIESRLFGRIALRGKQLFIIFLRLEKHVAELCCGGHAGGVALVAIAALRVFAEGALHGGFLLYAHFIHALSDGLDGGKGSAQNVCAAGADVQGGYAGFPGFFEGEVEGLNGVDCAQLGGKNIVVLVVIRAFVADAVAVKTDMAVRLDKAGIDIFTCRFDDLTALGDFQPRSNLCDLPVFTEDVPKG